MPKSTIPEFPGQSIEIHGTSNNSDALEFWRRWHMRRPKDKRAKWSYVYVASGERDFHWRNDAARVVKIGVSVRPWERVKAIHGARTIIFARWVHRPYILERGLHSLYREYGLWDIKYRQEHGDEKYWEDRWSYLPSQQEWFCLPPNHLNDAMRYIDFWQVVTPVIDDAWHRPPSTNILGKETYHFEYDSFRDDLAHLGRM